MWLSGGGTSLWQLKGGACSLTPRAGQLQVMQLSVPGSWASIWKLPDPIVPADQLQSACWESQAIKGQDGQMGSPTKDQE